MKTLLLLYKLLFPLGVAMLITVFVLESCQVLEGFTVGFLEGMSTVFIVAGAAVILGAYLGEKKARE